ncbi:MAG: aldehyde dehydrogenase family protein [Ornithinimicrobium sp.]
MTTPSETTFDVSQPGSGSHVGSWPIHDERQVREVVAVARAAAGPWAALSFRERRKHLDGFRAALAQRSEELADLVHAETGKPRSDAMLEIVLALSHVAWVGKHAGRVLRRRRVAPSLLAPYLSGTVEYRPFGVVGVIGPWNFPVFTPLGATVSALAAGNTVVFKPSELTPGVGAFLAEVFAEATGERDVLRLVTGLGETGAALAGAGVDKVAFTGSTATAKKVMAVCAQTLTPMVAECGGKDALIVDADADVDAAAEGAAWGALMNAGQACIGTERIYVHERVYDEFLVTFRAHVAGVEAGIAPGTDIGPLTLPSQVDVVRRHVDDAVSQGAKVVVGGSAAEGDVLQPTIMTGVPHDAPANQEETFGPTVTVHPVADMDEAVTLANDTSYGLAAVVYAGRQAERIAAGLRVGMVSINNVFGTAELASMPFGGVGDSGFGRVHGADGLREFATPRAVARQRFRLPVELKSFQRTAATDRQLANVIKIVHAPRSLLPGRLGGQPQKTHKATATQRLS